MGLVASCISNAKQQSDGRNDWHTVAVARHGERVWIHDPGYSPASVAHGQRRRILDVGGNGMVHQLLKTCRVERACYQGPPSTYPSDLGECMGRSAHWIQQTLCGNLPWPPDADPSGGDWIEHTLN